MRWLPRLAVLTLGIAAALTVAVPSSGAAVSLDVSQVPSDFAAVMGYTPVAGQLADGTTRLINPRGSCSVPGEGKPFDFTVACQAHDYGYDLLRYAGKKNIELPGTARAQIDAQLSKDLHVQCSAASLTCEATVAVFQAGVAFNSWRQLDGPPVDQSGLTRTAGLILLGGLGLSSAALGWRRRSFFPLGVASPPSARSSSMASPGMLLPASRFGRRSGAVTGLAAQLGSTVRRRR